MDDLKVAAICMHSIPGEVERNLDRIQSFVSAASKRGADIVCFPELSVTGYILERPGEIYGRLDSDRVIGHLVRMARQAVLVIMAGLIELSHDGMPYITQVIAGPEGLMGLYRKTHMSPAEKAVFRAGEKLQVFSFGNTCFGLQLCYEAHFPEISTVMALKGAEILFIPHASPRGNPEEKLQSWLRHLTARAFDNGVFVVACNQVGRTEERFSFPGVAVALGPDGQVLARHAGTVEKILFVELEAEKLNSIRRHRMKYFIPHRRPEFYGKIVDT